MIPTVFITREWSRTWIHEGQVYIFSDVNDPMKIVSRSCRATSSPYDRHASFCSNANIGEMLFGEKSYEKKFYGHFIGGKESYRVIYMDDARVCPFCGNVDLSRAWEDGDERENQWHLLPRDCYLSDGGLAVVEAVAKLNEQTPEFLYRMCENCRRHHRRPITSMAPPKYRHALRMDALPYEILAVSIDDNKDRDAWWETKLICHGIKQSPISETCVKKAIEMRLRRKALTRIEHEALALMLAASTIKKMTA